MIGQPTNIGGIGSRLRPDFGKVIDRIRRITDPIGPVLHGVVPEPKTPVNISWVVLLSLVAAISLFLVTLGQGAGRRSEVWPADILFWSGIVFLLVPFASRISLPVLSRAERLTLLVLLGEALLIYKLLYAPTNFEDNDEMLHWVSAYNILRFHQLFLPNSLLVVSPYYPALEIFTTALVNLTGLSLFMAAGVVLFVLRATLIIGLFLFLEKLSGSSRLAAIGCLIYMACPTFVVFDAAFAYESLGVVMVILIALVEANFHKETNKHVLWFPLLLVASLSVTHHISAIWGAMYMSGLVFIEILRRDDEPLRSRLRITGPICAAAILLPAAWILCTNNPLITYIKPILYPVFDTVVMKVKGGVVPPREMFVSANGQVQPFLNRFVGITSTLILVLCLTTGFFRAISLNVPENVQGWSRVWRVMFRRRWNDSRVVLLTICSFGFPLSVMFRLAPSGQTWEIGNRMSTWVFVAVGLVVATAIIHYWQTQVDLRYRVIFLAVVLGDILIGGLIIGSGSLPIRVPYTVGADALSIEPMGIDAARWSYKWLGEGQHFMADRENKMLLSTYGHQKLSEFMASQVFLPKTMDSSTLWPIWMTHTDYLLVDLRLTTSLSLLGEYYQRGEDTHGRPPVVTSLLKFDDNKNASRIFDDGWIVIYRVKGIQ